MITGYLLVEYSRVFYENIIQSLMQNDQQLKIWSTDYDEVAYANNLQMNFDLLSKF